MKAANNDIKAIRDQDAASLKAEIASLKKEQFNLRFQQATGQLEKSSRINEVRKDIARVQTVLREKSSKAKV